MFNREKDRQRGRLCLNVGVKKSTERSFRHGKINYKAFWFLIMKMDFGTRQMSRFEFQIKISTLKSSERGGDNNLFESWSVRKNNFDYFKTSSSCSSSCWQSKMTRVQSQLFSNGFFSSGIKWKEKALACTRGRLVKHFIPTPT